MAVLQIAILFGVGSHVVTLYFGLACWPEGEEKVVSRQRAGNIQAAPTHPIYGHFFLYPEPSV